jgi:hypothetical protein
MKRKVYIVPTINVQTISIQHMICNSITGVGGNSGIDIEEGDPEPSGGGDSRRQDVWDDEDDYDM